MNLRKNKPPNLSTVHPITTKILMPSSSSTFTTIMISSIIIVGYEYPFLVHGNCKKTTHSCKLSAHSKSRYSLPICYEKLYARISTIYWMLMQPDISLHFPCQWIILIIRSRYLHSNIIYRQKQESLYKHNSILTYLLTQGG